MWAVRTSVLISDWFMEARGRTFVQGQAYRLVAPGRPFLLGKEAEVDTCQG